MNQLLSPRQLFVTTALPYANGSFHIGHIMEYIQADIWVRHQRMGGHTVNFVGADDAHGAPIMIAAEKQGITAQAFVAGIAKGRQTYLDGFYIGFDHWHSTESPENTELAQQIYRDLRQAGFIDTKTIEQFYDPEKGMFLADRYIKGDCPKCGAKDQYGDNCEQCGAVYSPTDLVNPRSTLSGAAPVLKSSEHYFFKLSDPRCIQFLENWTQDGKLQPEVANKVKEWFSTRCNADGTTSTGLNDWDISRDAPYFGIEIPDAPGKYFYVWLDAPVGYLASLKHLLTKRSGDTKAYDNYMANPNLEQYHFIGKDIVTFHTLFWPAMLHFSGRKTPDNIFVHGFLTINKGEKMSKSRGTGLDPLKYLTLGMNPEWLRYYLAAKLSSKNEDIDFNADDFMLRVNSDLIGKFVNIASRAVKFIPNNTLVATVQDANQDANAVTLIQTCQQYFEGREYSKALRDIMAYADKINAEFDTAAPWKLIKAGEVAAAAQVGTSSIQAFKVLAACLKPILPNLAIQAESFLNCESLNWSNAANLLPENHVIGQYQHLMQRVDIKQLDALFETSVTAEKTKLPTPAATSSTVEIAPTISIDDFAKIDLRVAKIIHCEAVVGSKKLLRLTLDVGEDHTRIVFSGIASAYQPETLIGKLTVVVANLAPRTMKFGVSEAMVLAASGQGDKGIYILEPTIGAVAGMRIN
jgi:methionyl-tRNA synthetase